MSSSPNGVGVIVLYGSMIAMVMLQRRGRLQTKPGSLQKGERQRPLMMTWLDPVLGLVFIGSVLWGLACRDAAHVAAAAVGAAGGVPIGVARARTMYVRPVPEFKSVVFRRSPLEYGLLFILLLLRFSEEVISKLHSGVVTYALAALIALAVSESITRAAAITVRYRQEAVAPASAD
jgi:hypothetical protein